MGSQREAWVTWNSCKVLWCEIRGTLRESSLCVRAWEFACPTFKLPKRWYSVVKPYGWMLLGLESWGLMSGVHYLLLASSQIKIKIYPYFLSKLCHMAWYLFLAWNVHIALSASACNSLSLPYIPVSSVWLYRLTLFCLTTSQSASLLTNKYYWLRLNQCTEGLFHSRL